MRVGNPKKERKERKNLYLPRAYRLQILFFHIQCCYLGASADLMTRLRNRKALHTYNMYI